MGHWTDQETSRQHFEASQYTTSNKPTSTFYKIDLTTPPVHPRLPQCVCFAQFKRHDPLGLRDGLEELGAGVSVGPVTPQIQLLIIAHYAALKRSYEPTT